MHDTKAELTKLTSELAYLKGVMSAMERPREAVAASNLYAVEKSFMGGVGDSSLPPEPMQLLFQGVGVRADDPESISKAGARMIENMVRNPAVFGKPMMDPGFCGLRG